MTIYGIRRIAILINVCESRDLKSTSVILCLTKHFTSAASCRITRLNEQNSLVVVMGSGNSNHQASSARGNHCFYYQLWFETQKYLLHSSCRSNAGMVRLSYFLSVPFPFPQICDTRGRAFGYKVGYGLVVSQGAGVDCCRGRF